MKTKEFNLSDKMISFSPSHTCIMEKDAKEFIKISEEEIRKWAKYHRIHGRKINLLMEKLNKLAGEKLVE